MDILFPVFALVFLTLLVYPLVLYARVASVRNNELTIEYFRVFDGAHPPDAVVKTTRNVATLFEAPVLFYVACIVSILINYESTLMLNLAWLYVASRVMHSAIHLTYNKVPHRLAVFVFSQTVLALLWLLLFLQLI